MIYLIRHGESTANVGERSDSHDGIPLTEKGRQQAILVADRARVPRDIVTSKYLRTKQTAAPTMRMFPSAYVHEWAVEEFTYLNPDKYVRSTYEEREAARNEYWTRADPYYRSGGVAESFADLRNRVQGLIACARAAADDRVMVFTHSRFMVAVLWFSMFEHRIALSAKSMNHFERFNHVIRIPNCGVIPMTFDEHRPVFGPVIDIEEW